YFSGDEYMIGDLAYGLTPTLIVGFKGALTADQRNFNKRLSAARSKSEHSFGLFKGRFKSLTNFRAQIKDDKSLQEASMHIAACVVLHNILVRSGIHDPYREELIAQGITMNDAIERQGDNYDHEVMVGRAMDIEEERDEEVEMRCCEDIFTSAQLKELRAQGVSKRHRLMTQVLRRHHV
ncbi:hypothetical protein BGZ65_007169, partial [Modicella reniformis]